ncbi:hypothetical protein [Dokdonella sp.]|uniref:hypothetical protein n=1 Tax=Dokdonella sp. TaxID=2291710 RepID=UPI003AF8F41C
MGIEVCVPRAPLEPAAAGDPADVAPQAIGAGALVALFADPQVALATGLVADLVRALRFAGIRCVADSGQAPAALAVAAGAIMLGPAAARRAGALLPAQRQTELAWIVTAELTQLRGDVPARRALWSEIRRLAQRLATPAGHAPVSGGACVATAQRRA